MYQILDATESSWTVETLCLKPQNSLRLKYKKDILTFNSFSFVITII